VTKLMCGQSEVTMTHAKALQRYRLSKSFWHHAGICLLQKIVKIVLFIDMKSTV